jgi:hypothetical protein
MLRVQEYTADMRNFRFVFALLFSFFVVLPVQSQTKRITASEAKDHVGERATVCGQAASTRYADRTKGQPAFLNLDAPYPNQIFTIVIWGSDRAKFGEPETKYRDKRVCATGSIKSYHGIPEIEAHDPTDIDVQK